MIHLLFGDDEFTIRETLLEMKNSVGAPEVRDVNIVTLGGDVSLDELAANAGTVPFLSDKRLVIVDRLLTRFERGPRRSSSKASSAGASGKWKRGFLEMLDSVPQTTDLVFVDGPVSPSNPVFKLMQHKVTVRKFVVPGPRELLQWIASRALYEGAEIEEGAVRTLAETIGQDLPVIASEIRKLAIAASGRTITAVDVDRLVSYARESNIFAAVDAVIEGRVGDALGLVHGLLRTGNPTGYIVTMIARQLRLLILAKDIDARRLSTGEASQRLKLSGYPLRKTLHQADRFGKEQLFDLHRTLLDADLAMKSTGADDELILDTLIADIASRPKGGRPEDLRA